MANEKKIKLLNNIQSPDDLRRLNIEQLPELCNELREKIIEEGAVNPGHLASSLGAIEITVGCHYVFDTPEDRLVWDVGHQAYAHKIITGRRDKFYTNRQLNGIKPFPSPLESKYDTFVCGHASNSISAALGMTVASQLTKHSERHVVAVIGDGAMSGGLAFEGLNNVSSKPNDLLIILNDNDMSIDRAVGGMEKYLLTLDTNETYNRLRFRAAQWLRGKGMLNDERRKGIIRLTNALKSALARQQNLFEGMNIRYFGPFDGNDVMEVVRLLKQLKNMKGPKLLHLHTVKGKGFIPAEQSATIWHAPGKFNPQTGQRIVQDTKNKSPRFQDVFGETLLELAERNPRIVGVTPAMPTGSSLNIMMEKMPDRTFDVGIAEGHAMTFSAGMAKDGLQPFCSIYSSFAQRAYDNIIHDTAILNLPVVLCLDRAGLVGEDGATHHGAFDLAYLRPIPNTTIASPLDEHELRRMMYTAQLPNHGLFVIRYPRGNGLLTDWRCPLEEITVGKGRKLADIILGNNPRHTIGVLTIGPIGNEASAALRELQIGNSLRIMHYDMRFLKPIDEELLREVANECTDIITIEDGVRNGGLGTAVTEWMADNRFHPNITRMGLPDRFIDQGTVNELRALCGIDRESIKNLLKTIASSSI